MIIQKAFKYRIYPTKIQEKFLEKQFGASRFVYNYFLNERKIQYLENKKSLSYYDNSKSLTELKQKDGYAWLNESTAQILQQSLRHLEVAYSNFFKKRSKFPKFKKKSNNQCIKIPQKFKIKNNNLFIPKLDDGIKIIQDRFLEGKIISLSIRKTCTNKYYASILCEVENNFLPESDQKLGIDVGIKNFLVDSNNQIIKNPKFLNKLEKKIKYNHRQLSKKKLGSNNRNKQGKVLAKIYEKINNQRSNFLHQISKKIINENQIIISEDLDVVKMMKNHFLSKKLSDISIGEFFRQLEYKSKWYGRIYHKIDKYFPSSKTCNKCKFVLDSLDLKIRNWVCPNCNQNNDRDLNAAKNILEKGLNDLSVSGMESDVKQKLVEALASAKSMKQEVVNES